MDVLLIVGVERQQNLTPVLLNLLTSVRTFWSNVRCLPRRHCAQRTHVPDLRRGEEPLYLLPCWIVKARVISSEEFLVQGTD